jgi:ABC-2 type transport system permease protein
MLKALISKEIKDLIRDPRIWIPVVIGFLAMPIIGVIQTSFISGQIAQSAAKPISVELSLEGSGNGSREFLSILDRVMASYNITLAPQGSFPRDAEALVVINASSIGNLLIGGRVISYVIYRASFGAFSTSDVISSRIQQAITETSRLYIARSINITNYLGSIVSPSIVVPAPYVPERNVVVVPYDPRQYASITLAQVFIPMIFFIVAVFILQYSAISMAVENEERTLEVLLSMPIPRYYIAIAKLSASGFIGLLSLAGFVIGLLIYERMLTSSIQSLASLAPGVFTQLAIPRSILENRLGGVRMESLASVMSITPDAAAILAIYILEAVLLSGVIGIIVGGVSSDARMAQTLSGNITFVLLMGMFAVTYSDPSFLPKWALLTNPLTGVMLYSRIAFMGSSPSLDMAISIAISTIVTGIAIYLSGRMLSIETLERVKRGALKILRRSSIGERR